MNFEISLKQQIILLIFYSVLALIFAYVAQFGFDLEPCILCLHQRKAFFAIIIFGLTSLAFLKSEEAQKFTFFFCLTILLFNAGLAAYHVGVEKKIFVGPTSCTSESLNDFNNVDDLRDALAKTKAIRCDEPSFVFLGLSMAGWNFIYCLLLVVLSTTLYRKKIIRL